MDQNTFIKLLVAIVGVSSAILFQIYRQRDRLLDKITILDLYGSGKKALRLIKDIEEHPRASLITNGYYIQSKKQLSSFSNGIIVNVIIFITPLFINILNNMCIENTQIISLCRCLVLLLSLIWIFINVYLLRKYDIYNRKILNIS
jgi:hypothetical protein